MILRRGMNNKQVELGDRLTDQNGKAYLLKDISGSNVSVTDTDGVIFLKKPDEFGCYLITSNLSELQKSREKLHSFWED
jgi:hypothetical protein